MSDEPFGRQPLPVKVIFEGDPKDKEHIDSYIRTCINAIERHSYDVCTKVNNTFTIYPRAVND